MAICYIGLAIDNVYLYMLVNLYLININLPLSSINVSRKQNLVVNKPGLRVLRAAKCVDKAVTQVATTPGYNDGVPLEVFNQISDLSKVLS